MLRDFDSWIKAKMGVFLHMNEKIEYKDYYTI